MNFQRGRHREDPEINLIPLIDVLLVILIFLMITTTYSKFSDAQATPDQPNEINVVVGADGKITINRKAIDARDVESISVALRRAAGQAREPLIVINADAKATHQSVVDVMQAAQRASLPRISFATQSPANSAK